MLADPWNPYAALPWLAVLLAAAVAVWNGRRVGWWALVVAASVVAQLHAGYLPLVAGVAAVVAVRTWRRPEVRATRARVPWLVGLAALLWIPPLVDLVAGSHNPWLLTRAMAGGGEPGAGVPIVAAVCWARIRSGRHSPAQVAVGVALGTALTLAVFPRLL